MRKICIKLELLIFFLVFPLFAYVAGENSYPSLSQNAGMQGNPAALNAYGSAGAIFSYEKTDDYIKNANNFLFGFWGDNYGAYFDWISKDTYDKSEWSIISSGSNLSRSLFFGNRFDFTRVSLENETAFSWSPGFIFRPVSFISLGFWSEKLLQYNFYQSRMQHFGLSIKPIEGITASWNTKIKEFNQFKHFFSNTEQNVLIELEAFGFTLGLEFPVVDPNNNIEFALALSSSIGSYFNSSIMLSSDNDINFKKFSLVMHSKLNRESLENASMIRVPLGNILEKNNNWSILGKQGYDLETLKNTFTLLEKSNAKAILFDFSNYGGGLSVAQEVRRGIYSLRQKGKRVAAYTNDYRATVIFAASAAERIILQPSTFVDFKGLASEVFYYKGLLDMLGIRVEMLRHGSYKSAVEPYTLDDMSSNARENMQTILNNWWSIVRDTLAYSRNINADFLDSVASKPSTTAKEAKKNNLADTLLYLEEVPKYMAEELLNQPTTKAEYAYLENWSLNNEKLMSNSWAKRKKIAVLSIDGMITSGYSSSDPLFGKNVEGAAGLIEIIEELGYSGDYEALVLRINSPGGSALASDELWHSIKVLKESGIPIIVSVGDMAASGAYYIACAADKIVAEANSIVGSIGIYGGKVDISELLSTLRINAAVVKTHESANSKSIAEEFSESDRKALQEYMDDFYNRFTGVVMEGRGIVESEIDSLAEGRVFTGIEAISNGLIDEIGGFDRAIEVAKEAAGLKKHANIEIEHINNYEFSFFDNISTIINGKAQLYPWLKDLEKTQAWAIYLK